MLRLIRAGAVALAVLSLVPSGARAAAAPSLEQVLSYPFTLEMASNGNAVAWVLVEKGVRNVYYAAAPEYTTRKLTAYGADDGQELTNLHVSNDGKYVVYVRGGAHDANWAEGLQPDPADSPEQPQMQVWSISTAGGTPQLLGDGDAPSIGAGGKTVAFIHVPERSVWAAPVDGSAQAHRLFFDRGRAGDLRWSPDGKRLAFVSHRGDHSFVGIYSDSQTPIRYLAPSTGNDAQPQWSPDGTKVVFARRHGDGGPPQTLLKQYPDPWEIEVADAATGRAATVWRSAQTLRDSYPGDIPQDKVRFAGNGTVVFVSEADNWPHLYAVSARGGRARLLTPGAYWVEESALTPDGKTLVYTANTGTAAHDIERRHLFKVDVASGRREELTGGATSEWSPFIAGGGSDVAFIQAGPKQPYRVAVGSIAQRNWRAIDADRIPASVAWNALVEPKAVTFRSADGMLVHGQLFESAGGAKKKPALIFVHGGPSRQMLLDWHYMDYYANAYAVNQYLATRGYVVLSVNYRLGIGYGHDFHNTPHSGPAGGAEYRDVQAGAAFLRALPQVDAKRLGIWGGSYGGYLTAMALAHDSKIFKAGVDYHGVHDWSADVADWLSNDVRYEQPNRKEELRVAFESSPVSAIRTWRSPVLLIQGDDDRNVRFHQMVDLVARLRDAHVPYEELVIPNEIHGFLRWQSWYEADRATVEFFDRKFNVPEPYSPSSSSSDSSSSSSSSS